MSAVTAAIIEVFSPLTILLVPVGIIIVAIPLRYWKMKHVAMAFAFNVLFFTSVILDIAAHPKAAGIITRILGGN